MAATNEKPKDTANKLAAEVSGPTKAPDGPKAPTLEEIAAKDPVMQALLAKIDGLQAQLDAVKNPSLAAASVAKGALREFLPAKTLAEPKRFLVSLKDAPSAHVTIETAGVREIDWKGRAISEYNRCMDIVSTVHQHEVTEAP